jgi:predicted RecB family nuclease
MMQRLLTPSKVTAWLDCPHYLTLRNQVDAKLLDEPKSVFGSFARLLADKGLEHERDCLEEYRRQGKSILSVAEKDKAESFAAWVSRVGNPFADCWDVLYQMPFVHQEIRGVADFIVRKVDPDSGEVSYEPVDAKLARVEAKPGHVLQLCFYVDAVAGLSGVRPRHMHLWLGSGRIETLRVSEFRPYWNRLRRQLATLLADDSTNGATVPEPCPHCEFCEFFELCTEHWRGEDSLIYVAGIRQSERVVLADGGVVSLAELATVEAVVEGLRPQRLARLVDQATLQVVARLQSEEEPPPYQMIEPTDDPVWGRGFELLPEPDEGDVFLDFEGHPFWRSDAGLFFLFGVLLREPDGQWRYRMWWAHDPEEEAVAAASLIEFLAHRRSAHRGMHAYHYNHTERSALERLAASHGVGEVALSRLVETGLFVDLLVVARNAIQVGTESYGLKSLERLTTFERGHDIDRGAGAVLEYERYMADHDPANLDRIAAYNEDDVRATMALRNWLVEHRPEGTPWRVVALEPEPGTPGLDEQVAELHAFGPNTPEHLLGDLLGYWRRERLANLAPRLAKFQADPTTLSDDPEFLAGLTPIRLVDRFGTNGNVLDRPAMQFMLPAQVTDGFRSVGDQVVYLTPDGTIQYTSIERLDPDAGEVDLVWTEQNEEQGAVPTGVVLNGWIRARPKPEALSEFAARVLNPTGPAPNPVSVALLRRDLPAFIARGGPRGGVFGDDLDEMLHWATQLDHSYVAIQGPPGTGKTYQGAHLVRTLINGGRRVGITAFSHYAIDNLLEEIIGVFITAGELDRLHAVRRGAKPEHGGLPGVKYAPNNGPCARSEFNLVAGTTWLFAGADMRGAPVDVLLIDEAGQLALADALAASRSARNLILLGDPLQLPQVTQGVHPGGGGRSVLEHALGEHVTMPADRGVFLTETRRMHPDICSFISDEIYEGRLSSHSSCEQQTTVLGTGLRWLQAHHEGNSTQSPQEADIVAAEIGRLIGTPWTDQHGQVCPLAADDFMVVAPYNDQVNLVRARLDRDERTRGVPVGTVDKFQGQEAAVVFFTMATSTSADMTRGADFLFSRNRLNVAISRARCLAYLVCTEGLLNTRAHTVPEMRLLSTLCAFVEWSQEVVATRQ